MPGFCSSSALPERKQPRALAALHIREPLTSQRLAPSTKMSGSRDRTPSDADANERTRLLANPDPEAQDVSKPSSLPVLSTFALCWARGIEIWIFYGIFPYLPAFVERTGVPKPKIGYYVGMVESVFAVAQFTAMMLWSSLSDKYGRKPVLVSCLFGASLSISALGFSTEIWHMLVWRALAGVFAASAV